MAPKKGQESTRDIAVRIEQIVVGLDDKIEKQDGRIEKLETGVSLLTDRNTFIDGQNEVKSKIVRVAKWVMTALVGLLAGFGGSQIGK